MKRNRVFSIVRNVMLCGLLAIIALPIGAAPRGSAKADIPFNFEVNGKAQPAGEYIFSPGPFNGMITVQSPEGKLLLSFLYKPLGNPNQRVEPKLVFDRTDTGYALSQVWMSAIPAGGGVPKKASAAKSASNLVPEDASGPVVVELASF
jgi:hypothetical protein